MPADKDGLFAAGRTGVNEPQLPWPGSTHCAGGEQPADDGPARQNVRAEHLVGWVDYATDVADEVAAQRLAVWGGQVLPLEPVLVPLLLPEPHLQGREGSAAVSLEHVSLTGSPSTQLRWACSSPAVLQPGRSHKAALPGGLGPIPLQLGVLLTREVMKSNLVSMSGVSRQARNLRDVLDCRSCRTPGEGRTEVCACLAPRCSVDCH